MTKFLGYEHVTAMTGLSKGTIWRMFKRGQFPKPVKISSNRVGFVESDVEAWAQARIAESEALHAQG